MLVLFQRRFFESEHFLNLIDDTKAVAVLASKMCHIVNEWERTKKDESRQIDLDSLEKIKEKLNNIRQSKKRLSQTQTKHFRGIFLISLLKIKKIFNINLMGFTQLV